ncbi:hypothetical protein HK100_002823, partial [Physocladia obscura]
MTSSNLTAKCAINTAISLLISSTLYASAAPIFIDNSELCLDVYGGLPSNGSQVVAWVFHEGMNEDWSWSGDRLVSGLGDWCIGRSNDHSAALVITASLIAREAFTPTGSAWFNFDRYNFFAAVFTTPCIYACVIWGLTINVFLALTRLFLVQPKLENKWYFVATAAYGAVGSITAITLSIMAPGEGGYFVSPPEAMTNKTASDAFAYGYPIIVIIPLLVAAAIYAIFFSQLRLYFTKINSDIERKITWRCVIMGGSTFLCYLPFSIAGILYGKGYLPVWVSIVTTDLALGDCLITPLVILYFMPNIRAK